MSQSKSNTNTKIKKAPTNAKIAASSSSNNIFVGMNKVWWVPDDIEVWALANQTSAELPNGISSIIGYLVTELKVYYYIIL